MGPGAMCYVEVTGDPIVAGDWIIAEVLGHSPTFDVQYLSGTFTIHTAIASPAGGSFKVVMGANVDYPGHVISSIPGEWIVGNIGDTILLRWRFIHSFTTTDTLDVTGMVWEPRLTPLPLLSEMYDRVHGTSPTDSALLAAVSHAYHVNT